MVYLSGDIDAASIGEFQTTVEPLCKESGSKVLLECKSLNYVNSTGFGVLFTLNRTCQQNGGVFALCTLKSKIKMLMKVLGLVELLTIYPTQEDALEAMK